ncbi:hypothetical protein ALC60_10261, partial [Trachymyrmex zeteki]
LGKRKGGSMRGLGGGGGGGDGDSGGGAGGWLVGRFGGGCIGVVPSVRRQEGHRHTDRIRPHQSILRVQGHRPTNYPGLIDARQWRKKSSILFPGSLFTSPVAPLCFRFWLPCVFFRVASIAIDTRISEFVKRIIFARSK